MPWCPKCNAEYQEGFTVCSDCGVDLVDSLEKDIELIPFFQAEEKKVADKLARFFVYSDLKAEVSYDDQNELYLVSIPPKMEKQAKKLYQAFYFVERENLANGVTPEADAEDMQTLDETEDEADATAEEAVLEVESLEADHISLSSEKEAGPTLELLEEETDEDELYGEDSEVYTPGKKSVRRNPMDEANTDLEPEESASPYVMKADKYKDLAGTVWIFLFFGIVGLAFVLLNVFGFLTVLNGWLPNTIMGVMFIFFLYVGFSTKQKATMIKSEIAAENELTEKINEWFKEHFTEEFATALYNDAVSEELNYIKLMETVKEMLLKDFGPQNLAYLDRLVEEYYNENFD